MLLSKSPVTFTLSRAQPLEVSVFLDTDSQGHLQTPSALTFIEPSLLILPLPQAMEFWSPLGSASSSQALSTGEPGHEPQSFSHLNLCSFCGNLASNHGITVAAGKCTGHPHSAWKALLPHPTVTQCSVAPDLWFTGTLSGLICHFAASIRQQPTYYFTFVPA